MVNFAPNFFYRIACLCFSLYLSLSGSTLASLDYSDRLGDPDYTGLCEVYGDYFPIGAAVYSHELDDPRLVDFILKNFNSITPEWELKQVSLNPHAPDAPCTSPHETCVDGWHFEGMDRLANFARDNDLQVRGHTLIWPVSEGVWMLYTDETKTTLVDKETLFARMEEYIKTVMQRYGDVIGVWDVVNEPFHYNWFAKLKEETNIYKIAGEEFVVKAFEYADKYSKDGDILLVNETFVEGSNAKTYNLFSSVEKWLKQGVRIDGIGTQGHMGTISTVPFDANMKVVDDLAARCRKLGIKLEYTEVDIKLYEKQEQREEEVPEWLAVWQINKYKKFFEALRRNRDTIIGVTFWGLDDAHSVINYDAIYNGRIPDAPMLFDMNGMPKQNFYAVCDF